MALSPGLKSWQVPSPLATEDRKLGWLNESVEEGQSWLRAQRGYADYRHSMDILSGKGGDPNLSEYRSKLATNGLKRDIREIVGGLANIRPLWGYHSDNKAFAKYATMMNKVTRAIYLEKFFDRSLKEALQYAAATCTGWVRPVFRRRMNGRSGIQLLTYGSPCVLPNQIPSSNDWQEAYVVHLLDEIPIYQAHAMFPEFQDRLHPTKSLYWYSPEIRKSAIGNMWKRVFNTFRRTQDSMLSDLYIPIRYSTILDLSINTTDQVIPMGQPGSPWAYEVPFVGMQVKIGEEADGTPIFRAADEHDARLYPQRRLMISSEDVVMYDGPGFNWHGELDLIPFCVDDWPWEALGFSLVHEGYEIQKSEHEIERGVMDKIRATLDLPLGYDINSVTVKEAKQFDPMQPRSRIGYDGSVVDKPFSTVVPPETYEVRAQTLEFLQILKEARQYQLGIRDIVALAKARAIGKGNDQLETLMEAQGPIVQDISRSMERGLSSIGNQLKWLVLQYMTTHELLQYVGEDGVTDEVFDYDPSSVVPSHLPGENPTGAGGQPQASQHSVMTRAKWFAGNLKFFLLPHSVHEITQMTYRLMLLQMKRAGMPVSNQAIFEAVNLGNPDAVQKQYWEEKEEEVHHAVRLQKILQEEGVDMQLQLPGGMGGGGGKQKGRPPTGQTGPQLAQKGDGRPVTKESP